MNEAGGKEHWRDACCICEEPFRPLDDTIYIAEGRAHTQCAAEQDASIPSPWDDIEDTD